MKLRQAAKGQSCVKCYANDGTVVLAHYSGKYSNRFGNGMGRKSNDLVGAHLCDKCHRYFDSYEAGNTDERAAEFMMLCFLTIIRLEEQGIIEVK